MEIKILCNGMPDFAMEAKAVLESIGTVDYADWDYQEILANIEKYRIFLPNLSVNIDKNILKKSEKPETDCYTHHRNGSYRFENRRSKRHSRIVH